tara:strand:- start:501 stop:1676 length:1176 start_codon:yes stop_codon:yes gene_type:complete
MKIFLITDNFPPIINSGSIIMDDLAKELISKGHQVTIITFVPRLESKFTYTSENELKVLRIRVPTRNYGMIGRLIAEITYSRKIKRTLKQLENLECDALICYSPSIFFGDAVKWIKEKFGVKAYLVLRDIFPKWVVDAGIIRKGLLYRFFKYIEIKLYKNNDLIGIESKLDMDYFLQYVSKEKVEVLNNWGSPLDIKAIKLKKKTESINTDKVNILYGGNMGDAQDLLSLVKLVDTNILSDKAIITLVGSGNQVKDIADYISSRKINNIKIFPEVDRDTYIEMLLKADIGIVSLNRKLGSNNFPLKMMGYIQLSKPILASVNQDNEIIDLINENNIGLVSLASDAKTFNKNLSTIINDPNLRASQGKKALELFNRDFTVHSAAKQILRIFT